MELPRSIRFIYTRCLPQKFRQQLERKVFGPYPHVFDRKKFIFVHIPKTAGKSIDSMTGVKGACHLTYREYEKILGGRINQYHVFTVVREPVGRLISAYNYALAGGNGSREDSIFSHTWIKGKGDINDFIIRMLRQPEVASSYLFIPQVEFLVNQDLVIPDTIQILKFENLQSDIKKLPQHFIVGNLTHRNKGRIVSNVQLSRESMEVLRDVYNEDFTAFQYAHPETEI